MFELPPHASEVGRIEVWSEALPQRGRPRPFAAARGRASCRRSSSRNLLGWDGDADAVVDGVGLVPALPRRRAPRLPLRARVGLRSSRRLREVLDERVPEAGTPPALDLVEAATLYQTLYWVARTAAVPTPATDVLHVTAAGWSAIPALVHKALHGTPMVLTEHGVYVREAYLAAARNGGSPGSRFAATRLARGLARVAYAGADVVSPVTDANAYWEMGLGIDPAKILVALQRAAPAVDAPRRRRARRRSSRSGASIRSRTSTRMLRVAAETLRYVPDARFLHYGPVTKGEEAYGRSCMRAARAARARASASASWGRRPIPTASCATPTSC